MKKTILLALSLLVVACGSTRKAQKSHVQEDLQIEQSRETERDHSSQENSATTTELSEDERVITQVEEYDTTQPVDPQTGTPPLKRKITQTRERTTSVVQEEQSELNTVDSEKEKVDTMVKASADTQTESKTRRSVPWLVITLAVIGLVALIVAAKKKLKLIRKLWQNKN